MKNKICLITGATGFIGQHIVVELVKAGYKVIGVDKPGNAYCNAVLNDARIRISGNGLLSISAFENTDVILYLGDVADKNFMKSLFIKIKDNGIPIDFVLHFAACATIQQAVREEEQTWRTNYQGTENILNESLCYYKENKDTFKGFFYASTDKVYGEGSLNTYQETDELKPLPYPYDQSKAKADKLVREIASKENFPAVIYRFCNVYGPGDYHTSRIIPGTLYRLLHKKEAPILKVYHDDKGKTQSFYRDMIYIKDLTTAVKMLLESLDKKENRTKFCGEVFNLGTENSYPMHEIIGELMNCSHVKLQAKEEVVLKGEIRKQCMNYKKLNQNFGFKPKYDLKKGIKETVQWYAEHKGETNDKFI